MHCYNNNNNNENGHDNSNSHIEYRERKMVNFFSSFKVAEIASR